VKEYQMPSVETVLGYWSRPLTVSHLFGSATLQPSRFEVTLEEVSLEKHISE